MSPRRRKPVSTPSPGRARSPSKFGRFAAQRGQGVRRHQRLVLGGGMAVGALLVVWLVAALLNLGGRPAQVPPVALPLATAGSVQATATAKPPTVLTGTGTRVSDPVLLQPGPVKVTMKHEGKAAFTVRLEDSQGNPAGGAAGLGSELTNSVGAFTGEKSTTISSLGAYRLNVTADGPWQITLQQ